MPKILIITLILVFSLAGCASLSPLNGGSDDTNTQTTHDWYPLPQAGSQITIYNKNTKSESTVTVIDSYHAASGHSCSLYSNSGDMDTDKPSGLACRDNNRWMIMPLIINPDAHPSNG